MLRRLRFLNFALVLISFGAMKAQVTPGISISSSVFCTGSTLTFSPSAASPAFTYTWGIVPGTGVILEPSANSETVRVRFTYPLNYTVYLTVAGAEQPVTYSRVLNVSRMPKASFNAYLNSTGHPNELILTNYSTGSLKTYWVFDNTTADSSFHLVRNYPASGSYSVSLIAVGARGCNDTAFHYFRIADSSSLLLPNIFTPNEDGVNDVYKPQARGITSMSAWILSRSGTILYRWDKPGGSWDGRNFAGEACAAGEYFIVADALGFDGRTYKLKSTITLVR